MKTRNSSVPPQGLTINALSEKTGIDRRTLKKRLKDVAQQPGGGWSLADVEAAASKAAEGGSLKDEKLREEIRKLRIANDLKQGELTKTSHFADLMVKFIPLFLKTFKSKAVDEATTPEERVARRKAFDAAMVEIRPLAKMFKTLDELSGI